MPNLMTTLSLEHASVLVDQTIEAGIAHGMRPLTVAVLDAGGHLVCIKRADGCGIMRVEIAIAKAYAAVGLGADTRNLERALADRPAFQSALAAAAQGRFVALPGGIPLSHPGSVEIIGAVGISGDTSDNDEACALAGIAAAGLQRCPHPGD